MVVAEIFILLTRVLADSCQAPKPEFVAAELDIICLDGHCYSVCVDDLKSPVNGKENFACADYKPKDYPFPTECQARHCSEPIVDPNTDQTCSNLKCEYSCKNGATLTGPSSIFCNPPFVNSKGTWGSDPPVCLEEPQSCKHFKKDNLSYQCTRNFDFETRCDFSCPDNFRLIGSQSAQCIYNNGKYHWSVDIPDCEKSNIEVNVTRRMLPTTEVAIETTTATFTTAETTCVDTLKLQCWTKNQKIIVIVTAVCIVIIIIAVAIGCYMRTKNKSKNIKNDNYIWNQGEGYQKEPSMRGSSRGNASATDDRIVPPKDQSSLNYSKFYRQPSQQRTQYSQRHDRALLSEEELPFINDPSNQDYVARSPSKNLYGYRQSQRQGAGDGLGTFLG